MLGSGFYCGLCNASGRWTHIWNHRDSSAHQQAYALPSLHCICSAWGMYEDECTVGTRGGEGVLLILSNREDCRIASAKPRWKLKGDGYKNTVHKFPVSVSRFVWGCACMRVLYISLSVPAECHFSTESVRGTKHLKRAAQLLLFKHTITMISSRRQARFTLGVCTENSCLREAEEKAWQAAFDARRNAVM